MKQHKDLAIRALSSMRGDDLERAKSAFRNCTQIEMQQQYGQSGKTRAEIIAEYEAHSAKIDAAIAWVRAQN